MAETSLRVLVKRTLKRVLRTVGVEAHGYIPGSSREAQLLATMRHFGVDRVLDVGANTGQFGLELIDAGYRGEIVSVEPISEAHAELVAVAAPHPRWRVLPPTAVGARSGTLEFNVSANSVSSSALDVLDASIAAAPGSRQVQRRTVPVATLDELMAPLPATPGCAMLKIDTQGYEWTVLDGAVQSLSGFGLVVLEMSLVPLYGGQKLWLDLVARMEASQFDVWALQPEFIDPRHGRTLQVNGIFVRRDLLAGRA